MKQDQKFLQLISNLHPQNNAINILKDIQNIHFFVYTIQKTGSTTLSLSLQKMMNNQFKYEHVVHCHNEDCWKRIFNLKFDFNLISLVKNQKKKPIIFQLSRDPVKRLISFFFHINRKNKNLTYTDLIKFLDGSKEKINYTYYQDVFDYKFSNLKYDKMDKCCVKEKMTLFYFL